MTNETMPKDSEAIASSAPEHLAQEATGVDVGAKTSEAPITPDEATVQSVDVEQIIIGEQLTDDDRARVYKRLGRPDEPDGYDLTKIVPKEYNQGLVDDFKKKAFEQGMSAKGVTELAEWYKSVEVAQLESIESAKQKQSDYGILELKREWGTDYEGNVKHAHKALEAYTDKDFRSYMDETGLGNNPSLVKAFAKIGRELSDEDSLVQSETAASLTKDDSLRRAEIARLRSDREFMDKYRRGDTMAIRRLNDLYNI